MKWYVLHVITGAEERVARELRRRSMDAFTPREQRHIRRGGKWHFKLYCIFPGYVFLLADYTDALYYLFREIPGIIRLLCADGRPVPLTPKESADILLMGREVLTPSLVLRDAGGAHTVVSGILTGYGEYITEFDWHRRRAVLELPLLGETKRIELTIEVQTSDTLSPG